MAVDDRLRFEVLGEVRAFRAGLPVDLGPAKQRAVLAVLLLQAGRPVPTHQIVDAVWGDEPPENGANVVQKYVAGLRRALDPDRAPRTPGELLALTGSGYVLRTAGAVVDADEFQAAVKRAAAERAADRPLEAASTLRGALGLWRGEALAGLGGSVFEAARTRLADARASAWETWAEIGLAQGRAAMIIPELTQLVAEFPLREGLRAQLMLALHQTGRQAEALAVFRDSREYFLDEFGAEPGERMQEAHRKILRSEPAPPPDPVPSPAPAPSIPAPAPAPAIPAPAPVPSIPAQVSPPAPHPALPPLYWRPSTQRASVVEVLFAAIVPLATCTMASWSYFLYTAVRRRDRAQFITAAVYFVLLVVGVLMFAVDPTGLDEEASGAETLGIFIVLPLAISATIHGAVVAVRTGDYERAKTLREQARQFATFDPARAIEVGVGRPDILSRPFDDGGLVDINHLGALELSRALDLPLARAQEIVVDRGRRGPFGQPGELVTRGLLGERVVRRNAYRLIAIPPQSFVPAGPAFPAASADGPVPPPADGALPPSADGPVPPPDDGAVSVDRSASPDRSAGAGGQ
ncbi:BTAD domain-containing putative transcriptional regulator [Paractinoplanes rhizophilus]|uniref:BTAD domain-containing putative transcriptional regulator n=1 Tax=Paractinoplanes rhizophilus TaxID=1416877 RepID=A0ABW2HUP6_9ACTN